ncbi:hypothetical protein IV203_037257 [Nitzschia inconspicua]|uniref:Uncharacterized protein n=1 Tax=Nitzschia inconspicua TaxID=303405 RepID=A0A9K3LKD9_9STRA|nr:hypothetical protein IV203_037257 [Nitzschia inconspicua]
MGRFDSERTSTVPSQQIRSLSREIPSRFDRLPQINLRPRNRSRQKRDADKERPLPALLSKKLYLPSLQETTTITSKRTLTPFQDSIISSEDVGGPGLGSSDDWVPMAETGSSSSALEGHSEETTCDFKGAYDDTCSSPSCKDNRFHLPSPPKFHEVKISHVMKKNKSFSSVTPSPLVSFRATNASEDPCISKPRPIRRVLFPTTSAKRRKSSTESSSKQTLTFSTASAFQCS